MRLLACLTAFVFFSSSLAAGNDTTKSSTPASLSKYFSLNQAEYMDSTFSLDNSLYDFHKYIVRNTLGNTGLPISELTYDPFSAPLGFGYYKNHFSYYAFSPQKLKFFNTRTPYTDLFYVMGTPKEQFFKMTFSYNVTKNWNITANLMRIKAAGQYVRQNTSDNSVALSTNFKSANNRYMVLGSIIYNGFKNSENGGIADDSTFLASGGTDKLPPEINLTTAAKTVVNANVCLKQIFNFGKFSTDTSHHVIMPESRIILTSSFDANYFKYTDENAPVALVPVYFDSTKTSDSLFYSVIDNELAWKRTDNGRRRGLTDLLGAGVSIKHQLVHLHQKFTDSLLSNVIAGAELFNTYSKNSFWWNLSGKYVANGYDKNDHDLVASLKKETSDSLISLTLTGESRLSHPDFIYSYYLSNQFAWKNSFESTEKTSASLFLSMKRYRLDFRAGYAVYSNVLYFDNYAIPRQYTGSVPVLSLLLKKDFVLWNWHLNNTVTYQHVQDSSVIRLPAFILEHSLYYENDMIKGALHLAIGASVFYSSAYYASGYAPASGQFYLQDNKKYGDYPFIDVFVSARVKTVRIFFKVDHLNSGWNGSNYMLVPGYPSPARTFKLGISWKFYD